MTNWKKCIDILRKSKPNDFRLIVFEVAKNNPSVLVKAIETIRVREKATKERR